MNIKVKYDGKYPNTCSGHLIIYENDVIIFQTKDHSFCSTGSVWFTDDWDEVVEGGTLEWTKKDEHVRFLEFVNQHTYKDYILKEAEHVLDDADVCCGGCV